MNFVEARRQHVEIQIVGVPRAEQAKAAAPCVVLRWREPENLGGHPIPVDPKPLPKVTRVAVSFVLGLLRPIEEDRSLPIRALEEGLRHG